MEEKPVGKVISFFSKIGVAAIILEGNLKIGDKIHIKGHTTDFEQILKSMQIDRKDIKEGKKGQDVGIKVDDMVRPNDLVYKVL
ncbi:MAG: translation elongation factor-like protein [archaeon]